MNSLKVFAVQRENKNYIQFDFEGDLTHRVAQDGIRQWENEMGKLAEGQKINLLFNCVSMLGFETEARKQWQEIMKKFKPQIENVWVISESIFIRGAARTMGMLTGYNIKSCRSISEVE
ncbi:MAG: hypothetical protein JST43_09285 [Bacteroidetes bacterium]|nr:hypothetical protein [Bacteroidota bacterium]MBS1539041.1 hypothetical protein [Bacteroidota bacterium]